MFTSFLVTSPQAEMYRWVDSKGGVHFTDTPPEKVKSTEIRLQINSYSSPQVTPFEFDDSLITRRKTTTGVIMYSATWCGVCKKARRYFQQQNIPFEEYDVEKSAKGKQDYQALRGNGVPIVLVGETRMNGFSVGQFERIYRQ
jgi:glutaredoxin